MKKVVTAVLVCLWGAHSWAAAPTACSKLWAGVGELQERDEPLWAIPSIPSEGALPKLKMLALDYPDGSRFIPRGIEESNCFLDRILDRATREAIAMAAKRVAQNRSLVTVDEKLDALYHALGASLRRAAGLPKESEGAAYGSVITNLHMLYGLQPSPVDQGSAFLRHAYSQGVYTGRAIMWYILLSYVDHLGIAGLPVADYVQQFRKLEASYAPPANTQPEGCSGGIDYRWPHMTSPLQGQDDIPEGDDVHFGVCRASGHVWSYHYAQGWRELNKQLQAKLCDLWDRDAQFSSVCYRMR